MVSQKQSGSNIRQPAHRAPDFDRLPKEASDPPQRPMSNSSQRSATP